MTEQGSTATEVKLEGGSLREEVKSLIDDFQNALGNNPEFTRALVSNYWKNHVNKTVEFSFRGNSFRVDRSLYVWDIIEFEQGSFFSDHLYVELNPDHGGFIYITTKENDEDQGRRHSNTKEAIRLARELLARLKPSEEQD